MPEKEAAKASKFKSQKYSEYFDGDDGDLGEIQDIINDAAELFEETIQETERLTASMPSFSSLMFGLS